jgi:hypothetical protein
MVISTMGMPPQATASAANRASSPARHGFFGHVGNYCDKGGEGNQPKQAESNTDDGARGLPDDGVGGHVQSSQDAGRRLAADHQQIGFQFSGQVGDHR